MQNCKNATYENMSPWKNPAAHFESVGSFSVMVIVIKKEANPTLTGYFVVS